MTAQAIADAMGARDASGLDLAESLAARIADHPALIVLDNCEHLTAGCRDVADRLDMRLPLRARSVRVLRAGSLALITGERTLTGTGLDGAAVTLTGPTALVARCQPDGTWLTAADRWQPWPGADEDRNTG
jgi:ketosteroid isomerase-like protein